jgi:hypothetical protein
MSCCVRSSHLSLCIEYIVKRGFSLKVDYYLILYHSKGVELFLLSTFMLLDNLVHNIWYQSKRSLGLAPSN